MARKLQERVADAVGRLDRTVGTVRARVAASLPDRRAPGAPTRPAPGALPPLEGWSHGAADHDVAVLVYRGVSSSEASLVADELARSLQAAVRFVAADPGWVVSVEPMRMILAEPLDAVPRPYGLVVPGGLAWKHEAERPEVLRWLRTATEGARGVIAVSTGSLLLAAAGLLDGQTAAGHWLAGDLLADLGANPSSDRVVHGRLLATASGALAGVDAAGRLAKEMRFSV